MRSRIELTLLCLFAMNLAACAGDASDGDDEKQAEKDSNDVAASKGPLYGVFTSVFGTDDRLNYANIVTSLDERKISLKKGIETAGLSRFYAPESGGFFGLGQGEKLTIERWDVAKDGSFKKGKTLSLQGAGVTQLQYTVFFLSATKAYYLDYTQSQIVVWNPKDMTITKTVDIPETQQGKLPTYFNLIRTIVRPKRMLVTMAWNDVQTEVSSDKTGLMVIDTDADKLVHFEATDRCAAADNLWMDSSGDAYAATDIYHLLWNTKVRGKTRPGCILRIKADEERFDPDYVVNIEDATGGKVGYGIAPTGKSGQVYVSVLDESMVKWEPKVTSDELSAAVWQNWTLDLATKKAALPPDSPHSAGSAEYIETDGRTFIVQASDDYATSQLFELGSDGELIPSIKADGYISVITRLR